LLLSFDLAVIIAVPALFAHISPLGLTSATCLQLELHVIPLFVASCGAIVADNGLVSFSTIVNAAGDNVIPDTGTFLAVTVTVQLLLNPPSAVLTVIVVVPTLSALTLPLEFTVATDSLFDDHVTCLSVAFDGATVAPRVDALASSNVKVDLDIATPVTLHIFLLPFFSLTFF